MLILLFLITLIVSVVLTIIRMGMSAYKAAHFFSLLLTASASVPIGTFDHI